MGRLSMLAQWCGKEIRGHLKMIKSNAIELLVMFASICKVHALAPDVLKSASNSHNKAPHATHTATVI